MCLKTVKRFILCLLALYLGLSLCACGFINKTLYPLNHKELIVEYGDKYGIPYELLAAVIKAESDFNETAKSSAGAVGLMQLMPSTAEEIAWRLGEDYESVDITDAETNIAYGSFYLNYLYQNLGEIWETALAAYNAGIGKVKGWLENSEYSDDGRALKSIPIAETENYVKRINKYKQKYKELYFNSEVESNE